MDDQFVDMTDAMMLDMIGHKLLKNSLIFQSLSFTSIISVHSGMSNSQYATTMIFFLLSMNMRHDVTETIVCDNLRQSRCVV